MAVCIKAGSDDFTNDNLRPCCGSNRFYLRILFAGDEVMARSEFTQKTKLEALVKCARCPECGGQFGKLSEVDFDHITPAAFGGDNSLGNCAPLCKKCHKKKTFGKKHTTYGSDIGDIAKSKRLTKETKQGSKKKIQSRGFQTNKDSAFKQTMGGSIVRRVKAND